MEKRISKHVTDFDHDAVKTKVLTFQRFYVISVWQLDFSRIISEDLLSWP